MNKIKLLFAVMLSVVLVGCGGHDYEGTWKSEASALGLSIGGESVVFGSDFVETASGKENATFETRTFDGKTLLDITYENGAKETYQVVSENELVISDAMAKLTLKRVTQ